MLESAMESNPASNREQRARTYRRRRTVTSIGLGRIIERQWAAGRRGLGVAREGADDGAATAAGADGAAI
jgi:hypothetical protein